MGHDNGIYYGMIIPNIWQNKECSKPPTSKKIPGWLGPVKSVAKGLSQESHDIM